jgi:integrase
MAVFMAEHGSKLATASSLKILCRRWVEFYGDAMVSDLKDIHRQEEFQAWLFGRGLANNSVNRVQEAGRTAINRAWKRGMIEHKPFIHCVPVDRDRPKGRPLTVEEIGKLYTNAADHVRLFLILLLGTAARCGAITSLTWQQVDFEAGLIRLNPEGRKQTSKRRATVKLVPFVREVLEPMDKTTPRVMMFRGEKMKECMRGVRRAVERAKLDRAITAYSCRHTVARWLRKSGVSPWETACQLGHRLPGYSITELYASESPDYLENAGSAIEKLLRAAIPLDAPKVPYAR